MGSNIVKQPPLTQVPPHLLRVADYEQQARQHMDPAVWAYLQGGSGDELTLRANVQAFDQLQLWPRPLRDLRHGHTGTRLAGQDWPMPLMLAPVGHQRLFHPEGERATALAAHVTGTPLLLSSLSSTPFAQVTAQTTAPVWLQLYWSPDRALMLARVRLAEASGLQALVLTVDAPLSGLRYRQQQAGFVLPPDCQPAHPMPQTAPRSSDPNAQIFAGWMAQAPVWDDVYWLCRQTRLPLWLKGITHPADAQTALQCGVAGLIVSNHGGRVLDGTPASLTLLPLIRQALPPQVPLLLDGGVRRGSDVFRALALGASAVLLGRPALYGLATAGALGVAHVLRLLQEELAMTMALCGCATVADIGPEALFSAPAATGCAPASTQSPAG